MLIQTKCNTELLYIDRQYLNTLKNNNLLENSAIITDYGTLTCFDINNDKSQLVSGISLCLNLRDKSMTSIALIPLNVIRKNYKYDYSKFNEERIFLSNTKLKLFDLYKISNFERLLEFDYSYNSTTKTYSITAYYLTRRT